MSLAAWWPEQWLKVGALRRFVGLNVVLPAIAALSLVVISPAVADETWNPFAEKDQRTRERARARPMPQPDQDRRQPLAPMTGADWPRTGGGRQGGPRPPQPYPATPPGYTAGTYQPSAGQAPNVVGSTSGAGAYPGVPYGAPGTYLPPSSPGAGSVGTATPSVERGELTPVVAAGAGLADGAWQGLDYSAVEQLLGPVQLPPASPALNRLFGRIVAKPANEPRLNAVLVSALLKAGRFAAADRLRGSNVIADGQASGGPGGVSLVEDVLFARLDLALSKHENGCKRIKRTVANPKGLPKALRGEAIVMAGYCAIVSGNKEAGGLAAELARDAGYNRAFTIALLEAIASGRRVGLPVPQLVTTLDGLLVLKLKKPSLKLMSAMLARAEPGFLQLVASNKVIPESFRLEAAERAASANVVSSDVLADAYRSAAGQGTTTTNAGTSLERARHFVAAEQNQAQFARTRELRALLDSARRAGLYHAAATVAAPIVRQMRPAQEISWFTETAVEILAAGGDYQAAREWIQAAPPGARGGALRHWLMLLDIADAQLPPDARGRNFQVLENLAAQGRFSQPALHRLATVLDALDYNVPIPLWNLASRSEAPQTGHLPEIGFLSAMKQASQSGQVAATLLYAMRTISPKGTGATHLLGLGDTIRALKRAGLKGEARRLGFEALFEDWPRTG